MVFKNTNSQPSYSLKNACFENKVVFNLDFTVKIKNLLLKNAKARAKRENAVFKLTFSDFDLPRKCMFTGNAINYNAAPRTQSRPTLYRLDPQKPYERKNVVVVSYGAAQSRRISRARTGLRRVPKPPAGGQSEAPQAPNRAPRVGAPPLLHIAIQLGRQALEEGWTPDRWEMELLRFWHAVKTHA